MKLSSNPTPSARSFIRLKLSERGERERNEERYEREEARSPPALRLEAPIRFLGRLERAHRGEQERKRQDELDNLAQNSDNDGVEITGTHDLLLLKKRPAYSKWNDCIGPFCFFRLTRGFPRLRQANESAIAKPERRRTFSHALLRVATPHLRPEFHPVETSSDAAPPARVSTG